VFIGSFIEPLSKDTHPILFDASLLNFQPPFGAAVFLVFSLHLPGRVCGMDWGMAIMVNQT